MKIDKDGKRVSRWGFKAFMLLFVWLHGAYTEPFVEGLAKSGQLNSLYFMLILVAVFGGLAYFTEEE